MEFDVTSLMNYGALGVCLGYFILKDKENQKNYKELFTGTVKDFGATLSEVKEILLILRENACNGSQCQSKDVK